MRQGLTRFVAADLLLLLAMPALRAQQTELASIIHDLDVENRARFENVLSFNDLEHYAVFRGKDQKNPVAEMTVRMNYRKGAGKTYQIISQSGSTLVLKHGLLPLLENERAVNDPATVSRSWFTSANYGMDLKSGATQMIDGRTCVAVSITPFRQASNMIDGTLWIDTDDHTLVELDGIASKSPSVFAGSTHMSRHYANMQGYAMATHATAESTSMLFGRTIISIDYSDYHFKIGVAGDSVRGDPKQTR